jgi:hypothetical protein
MHVNQNRTGVNDDMEHVTTCADQRINLFQGAKCRLDFLSLPPNLTPDPETGHITDWTEDQFVERFRTGRRAANPCLGVHGG